MAKEQTYIARGRNARNHAVSKEFNVDNGAATTDDDLLLYCNTGIDIYAAHVVYTEATDSSMGTPTVQIGTAQGGTQIVAATTIPESQSVSGTTTLTLVITTVAAGGVVWVRHTGVAATQVGKYKVVLEYRPKDK